MRVLRGLFDLIQPFPAFMSALAGAIFFILATAAGDIVGAVILFASIMLVCASFNALNDWHDMELDRATKPSKPIVRGDVAPATALAVTVVAGVAGCLLSLTFNAGALLIALVALSAGYIYDLWGKGTVWSWLPYGVFIPALPVWAFVTAGRFTPVLLLTFPLGILIALALNLANTAPDLVGDTAFGIRGLAHRLGLRRTLAGVWLAFGFSIALLAFTPWLVGNDASRLLPGLAIGAILLFLMIGDRLLNRSAGSLTRGWYMSTVIAAVLGIAWVASLPLA